MKRGLWKWLTDKLGDSASVQKPVLTAKMALPAPGGRLDIPQGVEIIARRAFEARADLVCVTVPATVREIGDGAFADCVNLERVTLSEGLESIGSNVFNGCKKLRSLVIPDSVRQLRGWAFYRSGLTEPVRSASGDTLYFCPAAAAGTAYTVPPGTRTIGVQAFLELPELREVRLPESLEVIRKMAFVDCGLREIVLPAGVREVGENAFYQCKSLERISRPGKPNPVRERLELIHFRGESLLRALSVQPPEEAYWKQAEFLRLSRQCARGDAAAMEEMTDFFERRAAASPAAVFYPAAANFWRCRAYLYGSRTAREKLEARLEAASPDHRLPSVALTENLAGAGSGRTLNALGFLFFDEDRFYSFAGQDREGVVEVSAYDSEDGPDEDGFGRETYYDWWYLDDCLCPVGKNPCLHGYSNIDRRIDTVAERFRESHDRTASAVAARRR